MTKDKAQNIVITFESLPKEDQEKVLKTYFKILLSHLHGEGKTYYDRCRFSLNAIRSAMQINQSEPDKLL